MFLHTVMWFLFINLLPCIFQVLVEPVLKSGIIIYPSSPAAQNKQTSSPLQVGTHNWIGSHKVVTAILSSSVNYWECHCRERIYGERADLVLTVQMERSFHCLWCPLTFWAVMISKIYRFPPCPTSTSPCLLGGPLDQRYPVDLSVMIEMFYSLPNPLW